TTTLIPRRIATTGITVLGAAGIATAALTGTAHAQAPAKPAHQTAAQTAAQAAAKPAKADDKADDKADKKAEKAEKKDAGKKAEDYPDNLDGWIREAMSIMKKHGIPGSYDGIKRNIIRESGGDPNAVNDWDINAQKG
ncbi:lysozyme family protein, partial [Streptomyces albus]|uniref:hypothetical protein n=1 Tax=Streptomyces sp. NRRL F-5639 TaxID=1463867 RepID=UPI0007C73E9A